MNTTEYEKLALRTEFTPKIEVNGTAFNAKLLHAAIGICTEGGELQDMLKKCPGGGRRYFLVLRARAYGNRSHDGASHGTQHREAPSPLP